MGKRINTPEVRNLRFLIALAPNDHALRKRLEQLTGETSTHTTKPKHAPSSKPLGDQLDMFKE